MTNPGTPNTDPAEDLESLDVPPPSPASRPLASQAAPAKVTTAQQVDTTKFSTTVDADVLDRAKDAFWAARNAGRYRVFGDLVNEALAEIVKTLAEELNGGATFPHRPVLNLPPGRVTG